MSILVFNVLPDKFINVLAVHRPLPLYIVSKSVFCMSYRVKKRLTHAISSVFYTLFRMLFEVCAGACAAHGVATFHQAPQPTLFWRP